MTIRNFNLSARRLSPRTQIIRIFRSTADTSVPPALTSVQLNALSYNYSTGVLSGLPSGWQETPAQVDITTTTSLFYSYEIVVTESGYGGSQTFSNLGSPEGVISFGNDIQSDNFVAGTSGWNIERDTGNAEFSNVLVRGNSVTESSTIGGNAAITLATTFDAAGETSAGSDDSVWTGLIYTGSVQTDGSLSIDFGSIQFRVDRLGLRDDEINGTSFGFTLTVTRSGTVINNIVIPTQTPADGSITTIEVPSLNETTLVATLADFNEADFIDLANVMMGDVVNINMTINRPSTAVWLFVSASFNAPAVNTLVSKPSSGVSAFITSDSVNESAADVIGGFGLKLNRLILFQGSETAQVLSSNNFTNRDGSNLVLTVRWDDATSRGALDPQLNGYSQIRITTPTELERAQFVASPSTNSIYDTSTAVFTWDGRRVGSVYYGINDSSNTVGNFQFRINIHNQDGAVSNFRITELAYEYTS